MFDPSADRVPEDKNDEHGVTLPLNLLLFGNLPLLFDSHMSPEESAESASSAASRNALLVSYEQAGVDKPLTAVIQEALASSHSNQSLVLAPKILNEGGAPGPICFLRALRVVMLGHNVNSAPLLNKLRQAVHGEKESLRKQTKALGYPVGQIMDPDRLIKLASDNGLPCHHTMPYTTYEHFVAQVLKLLKAGHLPLFAYDANVYDYGSSLSEMLFPARHDGRNLHAAVIVGAYISPDSGDHQFLLADSMRIYTFSAQDLYQSNLQMKPIPEEDMTYYKLPTGGPKKAWVRHDYKDKMLAFFKQTNQEKFTALTAELAKAQALLDKGEAMPNWIRQGKLFENADYRQKLLLLSPKEIPIEALTVEAVM